MDNPKTRSVEILLYKRRPEEPYRTLSKPTPALMVTMSVNVAQRPSHSVDPREEIYIHPQLVEVTTYVVATAMMDSDIEYLTKIEYKSYSEEQLLKEYSFTQEN